MRILLICSSHRRPDSGCPCRACWTGRTSRRSTGLPNLCSHQSACASSICTNVGRSGGGECAKTSLVSPSKRACPSWAPRAVKRRWTGCSTQDECVSADEAGADHGEEVSKSGISEEKVGVCEIGS